MGNSRYMITKILMVVMLLGVAVACSPTPKPSNTVIEDIVKAELQNNIPGRWIDLMVDGREAQFTSIEVKQWGAFNKEQKYWPVKLQIEGIAKADLLFKTETVNFNEIAEFRLTQDDFGAWGWQFLRPALFGGEQWTSGRLKSEASNKQIESTQSVSPTAVSSQKSASVTTSKVSEGLNLAGAAKLAVKETLEAIGNFPSVGNNPDANAAYGLPSPVSIVGTYTSSLAVLDSGVIRITYNENLGGDPSANGHTILLAPTIGNNKIVGWDCSGSSMPAIYRPASCN